MRFWLGAGLVLWAAGPCYAGGPTFGPGNEPSLPERVLLALCVSVHVAAMVESCWAGQRWYRPFAMVAAYAAVVAVWLGDRFKSEDTAVLLVIASGVWALSQMIATPTRSRARWAAAVLVGTGAAAICGVTDRSRDGFLTTDVWMAAAALVLWLAGLFWVAIRGFRTRTPAEPVAPDPT